ncbi:MAG: cupin domain-containing protein [Bacteroidales bacterium]|nr:cupin domain-containing protein [Bacteroidales bacterium]
MAKVVIEKLTEEHVKSRGIRGWPIWEKEVSRFDWQYNGDEECLILEGEVTVETKEGSYNIKPGDFVTFKDGLKCTWDIKSPIRKHYNFP